MSDLQARIILPFGDGEYPFALRCREIENLEKATESSVADIAFRVLSFRPGIKDIKNIIILGLEGGGMPPERAKFMFDRYCDGRPLFAESDPSAPARIIAKVMEAAWFGVSDILEQDEEPMGKKPEAEGDTNPATAGSTSPDTEQPS